MDREQLHDRVRELRAVGVPRCRTEDAITWKIQENKMGNDVAAALAAQREIEQINAELDPYFHAFARPAPRDEPIVLVADGVPGIELHFDRCIGCDHLISWSFTWGLVHGEGFCGNCGWPYRLYHFPRPADGGDEVFSGRLQKLLAIHPDEIRLEEDEAA